MISKTEQKILELLFAELSKEHSITEVSNLLKLPYAQTHRSVESLLTKGLVGQIKKGKTSMITIKLTDQHAEYAYIERLRYEEIMKKNKGLALIAEDLEKISPVQFICILFGSCAAGTAKKDSDIDLLFVIPDGTDFKIFEKKIKGVITTSKVDINITTEQGLLEMWQKPMQLNVGNELLKGHIVFRGADSFLRLRRRYYVG